MLKKLATRAGLIRPDTATEPETTLRSVRKDLDRLTRAVERITSQQGIVLERAARMEQHAIQIKTAFRLNVRDRDLLATLDKRLKADRVTAHVHQAISRAPLELDPFPHIVVDELLPRDLYRLALKSIPPVPFFGERDPIKQNLRVPIEFAPALTLRVWDFIDGVVARDAIRPAVLERFAQPLQSHYDVVFGPQCRARAEALPQAVSGGRLMLRRAGYHLDPHRDPKRALLTCLMYLARPKDSEAYGTQVFRVDGDREANYTETYYPGQQGATCTLVKVVPFRPNTALIFLNSRGAHGADIPESAPSDLERYAFQFYIGPDGEGLDPLIADLPPERRAMWRQKNDVLRA